MQISLPEISVLIKKILPVKASFVGDFIHPALGRPATQSIEQWRLDYLKELEINNSLDNIGKFRVFIASLLLRVNKGETGARLYNVFSAKVKRFKDLNKRNITEVLKVSGYRFPNQGTQTVLAVKNLLFDKYQDSWNKYFKKAKENYKNNFLDDYFLKIKGVKFKVRDLALSCFLKEYSANDFHVVRILTRTGLLVYGYGDIDIGTNPGNEKNYIFLRNLIIKLSEKSRYSPAELDRIFWHFGRGVCNAARPNCDICPINNDCLTSLGVK